MKTLEIIFTILFITHLISAKSVYLEDASISDSLDSSEEQEYSIGFDEDNDDNEYIVEGSYEDEDDELDRFEGVNFHDALSRNPSTINETTLMIAHHGYPYEEYELVTPDGYILKVFRIPGSQKSPPRPGKSVAFLQHGLLSSSSDYVVGGANQALAFILADAGYDVWLGNHRGNTNSRNHLYLSPKQKEFWQFSWHEIGQIDLPALINFVLEKTGEKKLHYIGHSQGTTAFFVMGAMDVQGKMMSKIKSMQALAPVVFMSKLKSPFLRAAAPFAKSSKKILNLLGIHELFPSTKMMKKGGQILCNDKSIFQEVCVNVLFLLCGYNSEQLNRTMLPAILANTPAGASVNQMVHYAQGINSGKFRMFDNGRRKNRKIYGTSTPPEYDLSKVTAPVALHYSDNDWMAAVKDVDQLASKLPNLVGKFRVGHNKWNHLDFLWAIESKFYLYDRVMSLMERFEES